MKLSECIADRIRRTGPVSFHEFMEWCLYDPELGYYTSKNNPIGTQGDFYTSPVLTPVFGTLLGKQLEEMWKQMGRLPFTIVEYGAGTGHLCRDIMNYLESNREMYAEMRYCIIEKSLPMRERARKLVNDKVKWYNSISEIDQIHGCVLSNELVDNFAVHRVVMKQELMEVYVDYQNGFAECLLPAKQELKNYLAEMEICLARDYATEINLDALGWICEVASALKSGYVITIDYGCRNPDLYSPIRSQGTLVCYYQHSVNDSFYEHIGEQDITSHVNFSALSHWGQKNGLKESGYTEQGYFLSSLGFRNELMKTLSNEPNIVRAAQKAAGLSHTLLMDMGSKYKVLIQEKGVVCDKLSGLEIFRGA
ncbi:SAM-dependent MidA family methyltransferase [Pedobacter sp. W3I1]|uniref:class I SAM-dependent methyltransferase n=1 Tax=Pedobacter sp. W3I1 TaxID=3042291 RepID=UPI002780E768|nr:SAM-dependent methyltransferase [Pedobacter sp. W3I1]MDQ0637828.1 SAM-dependent MidA family methyltransferase [Pedobacter sp. W3I1]